MDSAPRTGPDPVLQLHELAYSLGVSAALTAAATLGVADAVGDGPVHVDALAEAVGAHPGALRQLMRALAGHGVFQEDSAGRYGHTPLSRALRADAPNSRKPWVELAGADFAWRIWARLTDSIRTGEAVFPEIFGTDMFTYLAEHRPEIGAVFDAAAAKSTEAAADALAGTMDIGSATTVADIGGGKGRLLRAVLERHDGLRGVLFEMPRILADADPELRDGGSLAGRCRIVPGDCHADVPVKADIYLIKGVLHMWDDDTAAGVLRNIARNAAPGARVIVIDQLLDATTTPRIAGVIDLLMLVSQGGKERTTDEFRDVFERAGLELRRTFPASPVMHLVEGVVR
ncbi:methyltransferase [Actinomadura harenae]|uniref:Methyltransferase n=1 Tax=Actinomadura harenae TaxID=2483351 RepID=A0A3M2M0X7_9ACTN|nr:methyltransferase [Actinomadura harenae]RMI43166.1 methyltransferase [Actinomadura harenae]